MPVALPRGLPSPLTGESRSDRGQARFVDDLPAVRGIDGTRSYLHLAGVAVAVGCSAFEGLPDLDDLKPFTAGHHDGKAAVGRSRSPA